MSLAQTIYLALAFFSALTIGAVIFFKKLFNGYIIATDECRALAAMKKLLAAGYNITSDPLGEFVGREKELPPIFAFYEQHLRNLGGLREEFPGREISLAVKPSRFGSEFNSQIFENYAKHLCALAKALDIRIWFDAEKKASQKEIAKSVVSIHKESGADIGLAIQAMHSTSKDVLLALAKDGIAARIVKGAYKDGDLLEPQEIKANFRDLFLVGRAYYSKDKTYIAVGTHDDKLLGEIHLYPDTRVEEQFLFGVRPKLQEELLAHGKNILIYCAWGSIRDGLGFFLRRLKEGIKWNALALLLKNMKESKEFRKKYRL